MKTIRFLVVALLAITVCTGCWRVSSIGGGDASIDTDSDIDSDMDVDTDVDSNTDTDIDCVDGCLIDSVCYADGDVSDDNVCVHCDTALSTLTWSDNDGATCDDGSYCNGDDTCGGGTCSVNTDGPCGDDDFFCNGIESCDEDGDVCVSLGNPCTGEDLCFEDSDQCCLPDVPLAEPACNTGGDAAWFDSCGIELALAEDCLDHA